MLNLKNVKLSNSNYSLSEEVLVTLDQILDFFGYEVDFTESKIKLINTGGYDEYNEEYEDLKPFIKDWVSTLEDGMESDENIDYSDWLNVINKLI